MWKIQQGKTKLLGSLSMIIIASIVLASCAPMESLFGAGGGTGQCSAQSDHKIDRGQESYDYSAPSGK
ncbi:MAG: hypothetical protein OEZ02_07375, partial [Anaerolineae bacterium]|nr:hypothetical protein [Anaerolineae bacterium]